MYDDGFDDNYCYPQSNVLRNLLNIKNQRELEIAENTIVGSKMLAHLPIGLLDVKHFKALHGHLFGEIYNWAGNFRNVRISKEGSHFCYPENIEAAINKLFEESVFIYSERLNYDDLVARSASFLAELNAIHPFREGNGRTQMVFLQMALHAFDASVDFSNSNKIDMINAIVYSFKHDNSLLETELRKVILAK